jgi:hypothetical protein
MNGNSACWATMQCLFSHSRQRDRRAGRRRQCSSQATMRAESSLNGKHHDDSQGLDGAAVLCYRSAAAGWLVRRLTSISAFDSGHFF